MNWICMECELGFCFEIPSDMLLWLVVTLEVYCPSLMSSSCFVFKLSLPDTVALLEITKLGMGTLVNLKL